MKRQTISLPPFFVGFLQKCGSSLPGAADSKPNWAKQAGGWPDGINSMTNYHSILRVSKEASAEQIKHAYRCLVKMYHPDLFPTGSPAQVVAGERIREINIAYSAVTQTLRREKYQQARQATPKVNQPRAQTQPEPEHCSQCGKPTGYWRNVARKTALCPACKGG